MLYQGRNIFLQQKITKLRELKIVFVKRDKNNKFILNLDLHLQDELS